MTTFQIADPMYQMVVDKLKDGGKTIRDIIEKTEHEIDDIVGFIESKSNYKVFPIKKMIQLQLGCIFACLDYL